METGKEFTRYLADQITERSALGIAAALSRLITSEELAVGDQLPTVRDLARALNVSPTTVSQAWQSLSRRGLIKSHGRSGTTVSESRQRHRAARTAQLGPPGSVDFDLSSGIPDPNLLPDFSPALSRVGRSLRVSNYQEVPVLPELESILRQRWPYEPEAITVTDGALDAIDRSLGVIIRLGDRVLVENPTYPPILDLIETWGGSAIGVPMDDDGLIPSALAAAIEEYQPVALVIQPRAQNPTGINMSEERVRRLGKILSQTSVIIVEDDHIGDVAIARPVSFGTILPQSTLRVSSFAKSHGPDLRLAAVGGPHIIVDEIVGRRQLGPGWSSRLLQSIVIDLLSSKESIAAVRKARQTYSRRRKKLIDYLADLGVEIRGADGLNIWVPVKHEPSALLYLAAAGISAAPGQPFCVTPLDSDYIRVTCAAVSGNYKELAELIAAASKAAPRMRTR